MLPDKLIISKVGKYCKMMEHVGAQNLLQHALYVSNDQLHVVNHGHSRYTKPAPTRFFGLALVLYRTIHWNHFSVIAICTTVDLEIPNFTAVARSFRSVQIIMSPGSDMGIELHLHCLALLHDRSSTMIRGIESGTKNGFLLIGGEPQHY